MKLVSTIKVSIQNKVHFPFVGVIVILHGSNKKGMILKVIT